MAHEDTWVADTKLVYMIDDTIGFIEWDEEFFSCIILHIREIHLVSAAGQS